MLLRFMIAFCSMNILTTLAYSTPCKTYDRETETDRQDLDNFETTLKNELVTIQESRYRWGYAQNLMHKLIATVNNECAKDVFSRLLQTSGRFDWPLAAYRSATQISDTISRDVFFHLLAIKVTMSWQDSVFETIPQILTVRSATRFKTLVDRAKRYDYPAQAYQIVTALEPHQEELYDLLIAAKSPFNWRDDVFAAVANLRPPQAGKSDYPKMALTKLIQGAVHSDWPAAAYQHVQLLDSEDKYQAYLEIIEHYPILMTLSTAVINKHIIQGMLGANVVSYLVNKMKNDLNMDFFSAFTQFKSSIFQFLANQRGNIGAVFAGGALLGIRPSLFSPTRWLQGIKGLLAALGAHPMGAAAAVTGVVGVSAAIPHVYSMLGLETEADFVFKSAANVQDPEGLKAFRKLISRVQFFDWPSGVYAIAAQIKTPRQNKRFDHIIDATALVPFSGTAYSLITDQRFDSEATLWYDNRTKVSPAEKAFFKLVDTAQQRRTDWPDETYVAASNIDNAAALRTFESVVDRYDQMSPEKHVFDSPEAMGAIAAVTNEHTQAAVLNLVKSPKIWGTDAYSRAKAVKDAEQLNAFFTYLKEHEDSQQSPTWISYVSIEKLSLAFATLVVLDYFAAMADHEKSNGGMLGRIRELSVEYADYGVGDALEFQRLIPASVKEKVLDRRKTRMTSAALRSSVQMDMAITASAASGARLGYSLQSIMRIANVVEETRMGVCTTLALHGAAQLLAEVHDRNSPLFAMPFVVVGNDNHVFVIANWSPGSSLEQAIIFDPWANALGYSGAWSARDYPLGAYLVAVQTGKLEILEASGRRVLVADEGNVDLPYEFSKDNPETGKNRLSRKGGVPKTRTFSQIAIEEIKEQ